MTLTRSNSILIALRCVVRFAMTAMRIHQLRSRRWEREKLTTRVGACLGCGRDRLGGVVDGYTLCFSRLNLVRRVDEYDLWLPLDDLDHMLVDSYG